MIGVTGLEKRYGSRVVLRGLSLAVGKGEVAVVIGPSGGGKSSLLRCITGLERFDAGSIRIGDETLTSGPVAEEKLLRVRRRVGFVFQSFQLFPHMNVMDNLVEAPVHVLGEPRDAAILRAREVLRSMGLEKRENARARTLSGGEQQRVAIARALLMKPDALLFDEPTSALDPMTTREVLAILSDLARGGQTMIVVTHSMSFARRIATAVHVVSEGRAIESGPPEKVFDQAEEAATRAFLRHAGDEH